MNNLEDKSIVNFVDPVHTSQVSPVDKTIVNLFDPVHISQVSPEDRTTVNSFDSVQISQGESTSADSVQTVRRDNTMVNVCDFVQVDPLDWQTICFGVRGCCWADIVHSDEPECGEATMQVFVKTLTGKTVTIDVSTSDVVGDVKGKIHEKVGVPVVHQRLLFDGKQLDDVRSMSFYGIRKESTLRLLVRGRGGAPPGRSLDVLAGLLAAAERRELESDGRCLLCCARYGKDKWGDEWHWSAGPHQRAEAWARRQLDGGYLLDGWCVPCVSSANSSAASSNSAASVLGREFNVMHSKVSAQPAVAHALGKNAWTEVFKPEGYAGNSVDGFFLIDSFFYMKKNNGKNCAICSACLLRFTVRRG